MKTREISFTGKVGVLLLLLTVIFLPFSSSICIAAESAASAASEGAETVPVEPAEEDVAAAGEAGEGATKGLKGTNTIWYIAGGAAFLGLIALGLGGGGGGGSTSNH